MTGSGVTPASAPLFHLVQEGIWRETQASGKPYTPPTYEQDGFTHLTKDAAVLLSVANHFYKEIPGTWLLLVLDADKLTSPVKFEAAAAVGGTTAYGHDEVPDSSAPLFPHLYGPIDVAAVVRELPVERSPEGRFLAIPGL